VVREDQEAKELRIIMNRFALTNTLHERAVTYEERRAQSTIDLCWITLGLLDRLIKSRVDRELDHDSDHFPITTMLDMSVKHKDKEPKRNWLAWRTRGSKPFGIVAAVTTRDVMWRKRQQASGRSSTVKDNVWEFWKRICIGKHAAFVHHQLQLSFTSSIFLAKTIGCDDSVVWRRSCTGYAIEQYIADALRQNLSRIRAGRLRETLISMAMGG